MSEKQSDIGLIGLAVMGQNLALNIADHSFNISVFNRTTEKMDKFIADNPDTPGTLVGHAKLEDFVQSLSLPRKIIILVQAGRGTDAVIDSFLFSCRALGRELERALLAAIVRRAGERGCTKLTGSCAHFP